jgi:uncharacterized membrane protein
MDLFQFLTLVVTGFTACAEFGSYAFVHPLLRRLPGEYHLQVEKGLLRTFGRVMPVLMTLTVVLSIAYAVRTNRTASEAGTIYWASAACFTLALIFTIIFNVPINLATGEWDPSKPPEDWKKTRNRWEFFQGVRSWLLLIGFVLFAFATSFRS